MPKGQVERRTLSTGLEFRDVTDKPGTIAELNGRAVVYQSLSVEMFGFREMFSPGAFTECLARADTDLRALVDHQSQKILGRQSAGTLRITDTAGALLAAIDVPDVSYGRDAVVSVKRRDIGGMSFSFDEQEDTWEFNADKSIIRTVRKADIYEVTITAFPAYPETSVDVRSYYRDVITRLGQTRKSTNPATPERDWHDDQIRLAWRLHEAAR